MHTKVSLNVRHRVVSPASIAERTASLEMRLSKSGPNSSTCAGYAAASQHLIAEAPDAGSQNVLHEDDQSVLVAGSLPISCSSSLWKGQVTPFGQESAEMFLRQRYQKIQALPACGADSSLTVGIRLRCSSRRPQPPDRQHRAHPVEALKLDRYEPPARDRPRSVPARFVRCNATLPLRAPSSASDGLHSPTSPSRGEARRVRNANGAESWNPGDVLEIRDDPQTQYWLCDRRARAEHPSRSSVPSSWRARTRL